MNLIKFTAAALVPALVFCGSAVAAEYEIDPSHTTIEFKVKHLGISSVAGAFGQFKGNFVFDPDNVKAATAMASITANSIDTNNDKRDKHLRSDEFLNAVKFPEISFKSKEIKDVKGKKFTVMGDLTIHGVTKPVTLEAEFQGAVKDPWGNERAGFVASTLINRKDFGLTWNKLLESGGVVVGEDVNITINVEGIKKKTS